MSNLLSPHPFDDALPERLLDRTQKEDEQRAAIPLHREATMLSPYIVKVTHDAAVAHFSQGAYVIEDADIFPDEAPLVELRDGTITVLPDEIAAQLAEMDAPLELPILAPYPAITQAWDKAVPENFIVQTEPVDIFAHLTEQNTDISDPYIVNDVNRGDLALPNPSLESNEGIVSAPVIDGMHIEYADGTVMMLEETEGIEGSGKAEDMDAPYVIAGREALPTDEAIFNSVDASAPESWSVLFWRHARHATAFSALAAVLLLPLHTYQVFASARQTQQTVVAEGQSGLSAFLRGANAASSEDFQGAEKDFAQAAAFFSSAKDSLDSLHGVIVAAVSVIPSTNTTLETGTALVDMGERLARASSLLAQAGEDIRNAEALSITDKIDVLRAYTNQALPEMQAASRAAEKVDLTLIPADQYDVVAQAIASTKTFASSLEEFDHFAGLLTMLLGGNGKKEYLFAFQNNTELRPTGGFIGSFAELSFDDGALVDMHVPGGGSYDVQGQLKEFVAAPGPLQLLRARWEFQDANWFPDFPTSARKMLWFYEASGGPTMDGVVAVNATLVPDLLQILGPIEMPAYDRTINAENFLFETQKIVEYEYDTIENKPKAFIGDLAEALLAKIEQADTSTLLQIIASMGQALSDRDVQIYFSDNDAQALMTEVGWSGELKQTSGDYLMVVHTNLGGGKTDGVITQDVQVDVTLAEDGTIENTVTITKMHHGMKNALLSGVNNVDYIRLYVPGGSELVSASGFEIPPEMLFEQSDVPLSIDEDLALAMSDVQKDPWSRTDMWQEQGKTVFGNWIQTAPGETQTVSFTYRLPTKIFEQETHQWGAMGKFLGIRDALGYSLFVQKQSGVAHQDVHVNLHVPAPLKTVWTSFAQNDEGTTKISLPEQQHDAFFGWVFERL